jgi:hypothetical protein
VINPGTQSVLAFEKINESTPDRVMDFSRHRKQGSKNIHDLKSFPLMHYTEANPISVDKKNDLISLLKFIDAEYHQFYKALVTHESVKDYVYLDSQYQGDDETT